MSNYEWWQTSVIFPLPWIVSSITDHLSFVLKNKNQVCLQFRDTVDDWLTKTLVVMVWGIFNSIWSIKFGNLEAKSPMLFNFNLCLLFLFSLSFSESKPCTVSVPIPLLWLSGYVFVTTILQYWCHADFGGAVVLYHVYLCLNGSSASYHLTEQKTLHSVMEALTF